MATRLAASGEEASFTNSSGPMPAGSPTVMASRGSAVPFNVAYGLVLVAEA